MRTASYKDGRSTPWADGNKKWERKREEIACLMYYQETKFLEASFS